MASNTTHHVKLRDKKEVAVGTMAFYFNKPEGYIYKAGQHTTWTLINPPETDAQGDSRTFCYLSAPHEKFLAFACRLRDTAFKRVMSTMTVGTEIEVEPPRGSMVISDTSADRNYVFLAGGIGITPFYSMVLDANHRGLSDRIYLFYSNRTVEEAAFLNELKIIDGLHYKFIPVFTKQSGHITQETLRKNISDLAKPTYFIAGPPQFVLAMRDLLISSGVDDLVIKSEDFEGY